MRLNGINWFALCKRRDHIKRHKRNKRNAIMFNSLCKKPCSIEWMEITRCIKLQRDQRNQRVDCSSKILALSHCLRSQTKSIAVASGRRDQETWEKQTVESSSKVPHGGARTKITLKTNAGRPFQKIFRRKWTNTIYQGGTLHGIAARDRFARVIPQLSDTQQTPLRIGGCVAPFARCEQQIRCWNNWMRFIWGRLEQNNIKSPSSNERCVMAWR